MATLAMQRFRYAKLFICIVFLAGAAGAYELGTIVGEKGSSRGNFSSANELSAKLSQVFSECSLHDSRPAFFLCIREKIKPLVYAYGLRSTMSAFEALSAKNDAGVEGRIACHDVAHIIGEEAYKKSLNLGEALVQCGRGCGFGCSHGAGLAAIQEDPTLIDRLETVCAPVAKNAFPGQDLTACRHALGHGLADFAEYNLVKTLNLCAKMGDRSAQGECGTGAFMEIFDASSASHAPLQLPDDIPAFCELLPGDFISLCMYNSGVYTFHRSRNTAAAIDVCEHVPTQMQRGCFVGLGSDFHFALKGDAEAIWNACAAFPENRKEQCIEGVMISNLVSDAEGSAGVGFCRKGPADQRAPCFHILGGNIEKMRGRNARQGFCNRLDELEKQSCLAK